ncbi:MAG TPA: CAP domain-containing protein [Bryobacteraceae bacterium]|jgi:uncharacterized protein YkwD
MRVSAVAAAALVFAPVLHPGNQDREIAAFLEVHTEARAAVGLRPLVWSTKLASFAQDWANHLANSNRFEHRPHNPYGENLAAFTEGDPAFGARLWLGEKKDYHGEAVDGKNFKKIGHYTQMVWRTTRYVGYGIARRRDGMWVLVANYDPPGNVQGERPY